MAINKKKLALLLSIPIFMVITMSGKQYIPLRDLEKNYRLGRIQKAEYDYAAAQGKDPFQVKADRYQKCMESQPQCIASATKSAESSGGFWISPRDTAYAVCNCSFRAAIGPLPRTLSNYAAGLIFSLKTLLPIARNLLISLIASWLTVFAIPVLFSRLKIWLYK